MARRRSQPLIRGLPIALVAVACTIGCVHTPVYVHPADVRAQLGPLRRAGHAEVATTPSGRHDLRLDQRVEVTVPGGGVGGIHIDLSHGIEVGLEAATRRRQLTVAELIDHCPEHALILAEHEGGACILHDVSQPFQVDTRLRADSDLWAVLGSSTLLLGGVVGLGVCTSECDEPWRLGSQITLGAVMVGAIILFGPLMH